MKITIKIDPEVITTQECNTIAEFMHTISICDTLELQVKRHSCQSTMSPVHDILRQFYNCRDYPSPYRFFLKVHGDDSSCDTYSLEM